MKRLVAGLLAALFTLFNGLDWIPPKVDSFTYDTEDFQAYYTPPEEGDSDYTALWREMYPSQGTSVEYCNTAPWVVSNRTEWSTLEDFGFAIFLPTSNREDGTEIPWTVDSENSACMYEAPSDSETEFYICAPATGTIATSHFACDYGRSMTFVFPYQGDTYVLTVSGAKCWYCCRDKKEPESGLYTATTSNSLKGTTIPSGGLLCVGWGGTKVTIAKQLST